MNSVLKLIEPADRAFQSRAIDLLSAWDVIKAVQEMMRNLSSDDGFLQLLSDEFLSNKRHRKLSRKLNEFLLYDSEAVGHVENMELETRTLKHGITCEASFSTCSTLLSPFRRSMTHARMNHLVLISFERQILESTSNEELLRRFHKAGNRRLQLY
ncbi:hypothetical protein T11_14325 [Trichinella zimbabwensis]|uniref:Uncharacterized protein n=1 Tax=Trichinella zimbabwensis TaxID=268475 RepID=A0A0V1HYB6_9BILA|nr:hypothetical protein T11_14325 [Trichinella zimbabwensis]